MQEKPRKSSEEERKGRTFTEDEVVEFKKQLERRSGCQLDLSRPSLLEIALTCHNLGKYHCGFKFLFTKCPLNPQKEEYRLHTEFQTHELDCIREVSGDSKSSPGKIASPSFKRYQPEFEGAIDSWSPKLTSLEMKPELSEKTDRLERSLAEESLVLRAKHSSKLYTEDEVSALKKELQFESKGLISKSTQFHSELGYITKISFRCKFQNNNCPYLSTLTYTYDRNQKGHKLYHLEKVHPSHNSSCVLDEEQVHYNFITRKIDQNFGKLMRIIKDNPPDIKPKKVLEILAKQLDQDPQFIYRGIESKNNRRAAKKYFDNSVAKARNSIK